MAEISVFTVTPGKDDPPSSPYVHICPSQHSVDDSNKILLSPQLMTDKEIDETVDQLIDQLKKARSKEKRELKKKKEQLYRSLHK